MTSLIRTVGGAGHGSDTSPWPASRRAASDARLPLLETGR